MVVGWRIWFLAFVLHMGLTYAADESSTPYAALYQALAPAQDIAHYERLRAVQRVKSKQGVAPDSIRIAIAASTGRIEIPIDRDGKLDFPLNAELLAENPAVITNQPKGSLTVTVTFEIRLPDTLRVAYSEIAAALDQARAVVAKDASPGMKAQVVGVEFHFPKDIKASVTLSGKSERLLVADAQGRVIVMHNDTLVKDDPTLVFSHKPEIALPFLNN